MPILILEFKLKYDTVFQSLTWSCLVVKVMRISIGLDWYRAPNIHGEVMLMAHFVAVIVLLNRDRPRNKL